MRIPGGVTWRGFARLALPILGCLCFAMLAQGENVDLSTVPTRQSVQLTIYNGEDLTFVRDIRKVTFHKGINPLQFSWAGTRIDPTSVQLRFVTNPDKLEVVDTTFPHAKPHMLYWNVASEVDGEVTLEISYFTSGIRWAADYQVYANEAETAANVEGFVRVQNDSGEEYENAEVRLVVGSINLVEKLEQLLGQGIDKDEVDWKAEGGKRDYSKSRGLNRAIRLAEKSGEMEIEMLAADLGVVEQRAKAVVKEALSEYFLYTIEGTETIPAGWSKRLRSLEAVEVPIEVQYRFRPQEYGDQMVRLYVFRNDEASKLGTTPMPDGVYRVFRDNGRDGLAFVVTQSMRYVPIGDKVELNLGHDPRVIHELVKRRIWRDNLWLQLNGSETLIELGKQVKVVQENATLAGWDDHEVLLERVRNYSGKPIRVEIRRTLPGHVAVRSKLDPKLHDFQTVEFTATVASAAKVELAYEVRRKQGVNSKQNNVTLESAEVTP